MLDETPRPDTASEGPLTDETSTSMPEMIEIFGADPLVDDETGTPAASTTSAELDARFASLEQAVERLGRQASFLPPKLRGLGERIDALSSVLAHARCRTLLTEVLAIDDLVRAGLGDLEQGDAEAPGRVLTALAATLDTLLESQQVSEIETEGAFDPARHQAVRQLPVDEERFNGCVIEVDRRGFAHGEQVLRFAEVAVGSHRADAGPARDEQPTDAVLDEPLARGDDALACDDDALSLDAEALALDAASHDDGPSRDDDPDHTDLTDLDEERD